MVGRDLSPLILGRVAPDSLTAPVYCMIDDDPYKGLHMGDSEGIGKPVIDSPKCIETVVAQLHGGTLWKLSRYWDSEQYWSDPGEPGQDAAGCASGADAGDARPRVRGPIGADITVKATPAADEYELYDLTSDPMELSNRYGDPACAEQQAEMLGILAEQREEKRLGPLSGHVPGQ